MRHPCFLALALCFALCCGCGKSRPPLAGGKPVRYWIEALQSPDAKIRKQAAFKLGNVGPSDPNALPALLEALNDGDATVRREAILAVLKCGIEARTAVPTLRAVQQTDPNGQVRQCAAQALARLLEN
jgi:HEAT repeat protein